MSDLKNVTVDAEWFRLHKLWRNFLYSLGEDSFDKFPKEELVIIFYSFRNTYYSNTNTFQHLKDYLKGSNFE